MTQPTWAADFPRWSIAFKAGYFSPEEDVWKELYGDGNLELMGQFGFKITPKWEVGVDGGYYSDSEQPKRYLDKIVFMSKISNYIPFKHTSFIVIFWTKINFLYPSQEVGIHMLFTDRN